MSPRYKEEVQAAIQAIEAEDASCSEKAEMLMEIAMSMQVKPKSADQLFSAVALYEKALELCAPEHRLLLARIRARMGTALQSIPSQESDYLLKAKDSFEAALPLFHEGGTSEEIAETEMNLGLVLQSLAGLNQAPLTDAIAAYLAAGV